MAGDKAGTGVAEEATDTVIGEETEVVSMEMGDSSEDPNNGEYLSLQKWRGSPRALVSSVGNMTTSSQIPNVNTTVKN